MIKLIGSEKEIRSLLSILAQAAKSEVCLCREGFCNDCPLLYGCIGTGTDREINASFEIEYTDKE